jgi:ClpP class serine protease
MFEASVARNRGVSASLIRTTDAGLFWAENAVSAGLADQVGTFDDALAAVTEAARASRQTRATASAKAQTEEKGEELMVNGTDSRN